MKEVSISCKIWLTGGGGGGCRGCWQHSLVTMTTLGGDKNRLRFLQCHVTDWPAVWHIIVKINWKLKTLWMLLFFRMVLLEFGNPDWCLFTWNRRSKHSCVLIYLGAWTEETMWPLSIVHRLWLQPQLGRIPVANVGMEWVSSWSWTSCQSTEVTSGGRVGGVGLQAVHAPVPLFPRQAIKTWL